MLPDGIPDERAVFTEPLAAACEILDQVSIPCGETVAVLGDGKLGLLGAGAQRARLSGTAVRPARGKAAYRRPAGAQTALNPPRPRNYEWVVDATGNPEGLRAAVAGRARAEP